ncbi:UDP-2,3-diacylglucosamine diphosphatase LpxI domain-containing protein [Maritalea mediterranea]|uniref:LpxI family protein n=1 Tax=Maritalea mediterranea TaxID=2909667 RepID=A0ABS9EAU5_9HYPH|nr:UDP-2,3-diacylglucosamine diphosphatase LpxI [Maritalea mediterranea]MCF4098553.1 LpxI family protein [Maritalea mediterranea]
MTKLALLLGEGALANVALQAAQRRYGAARIVPMALVPAAWPDLPLFDLDNLSASIQAAKAHAPTHICVAGRVDLPQSRRERMVRTISPNVDAEDGTSDLGLERAFGDVAAQIGATPIGVQEFAQDLLAKSGHLFGPPHPQTEAHIERLLTVTHLFGQTDLGQSLVFAGLQPVAGEDIGGTDALLLRMRAIGNESCFAAPLALVKVKKPQQSGVGDLPTIGQHTVEMAAAADIKLIIVEAGATLVLDQDQMENVCQRHGVTILGAG